jgi:hypothetical protein
MGESMDLKKLTTFMLPRDVREHVLGDLEEVGFTWGNLASVLPRIWWRHLWNPTCHRSPEPPKTTFTNACWICKEAIGFSYSLCRQPFFLPTWSVWRRGRIT